MHISRGALVRKRNTGVRKLNPVILGWDICPSCGAPVAVRQRVLGGVGRLCRRCCWFSLERSDGRTEEGGGTFYTWIHQRIGTHISHSPHLTALARRKAG